MCAARWPGNLGPSSAFSSSLLFKHAAFGLRFRSAEKDEDNQNIVVVSGDCELVNNSDREWRANAVSSRRSIRTSDLLLERHYNFDSHVENTELRLRFVGLQVCHAHSSQFLEGFVDVPDAYPTARETRFESEIRTSVVLLE